jgi:hypothetical protein
MGNAVVIVYVTAPGVTGEFHSPAADGCELPRHHSLETAPFQRNGMEAEWAKRPPLRQGSKWEPRPSRRSQKKGPPPGERKLSFENKNRTARPDLLWRKVVGRRADSSRRAASSTAVIPRNSLATRNLPHHVRCSRGTMRFLVGKALLGMTGGIRPPYPTTPLGCGRRPALG